MEKEGRERAYQVFVAEKEKEGDILPTLLVKFS